LQKIFVGNDNDNIHTEAHYVASNISIVFKCWICL